MKLLVKRLILPITVLLLYACSDPDAEIKTLDTDELKEVIDTLYIEKKNKAQVSAIEAETAPPESTSTSTNDSVISSTIENQLIEKKSYPNNNNTNEIGLSSKVSINSDPSIDSIETFENQENSADTQERPSSEKAINEVLDSEDIVDQDNKKPEDTANQNSSQQLPSTGFSEPTTQSETTSEIVLKELLARYPVIDYSNASVNSDEIKEIETYCTAISNRLSSVSMQACIASNHRLSPFKTVNGQPIVVTEFAPKIAREPLGKILVIGGTHGDELTSISTAYKWISNLNKFHSGLFHWHIAPALNVDAALKRPATRPNSNGVDINRNLPTPDWDKQSTLRWEKLRKNIRKNPGKTAASEPETKWIMHEIATFKPDAIVSIHAPYGILDFDSPQLNNAPKNFGRLQLNLLGTYPGSLGNYAGIQRKIPVLTLELPNATAMPSQKELAEIWTDMIKWLGSQLKSR